MQQLLRALLQDENAEILSGGTPLGKPLGTPCTTGCGLGFNGATPVTTPVTTPGIMPFNTLNRFDDFNLGLGPGVSPLALLAILYIASRFTRPQPQFVVPPVYIIGGKT